MAFANVELKTTPAELVAEALERQTALMEAKGYVGWKPQPADVLTILIEALGPLASDVAEVASTVTATAFRAFGTQLEGVAFNEGAKATATTTWTLLEEGGEYKARTIPAATQLAIGQQGFLTETAVEVPAGHSTAKVRIVAVEEGTAYNKLTGTLELVEQINWVKEVTIEGETSGGSEPESDEEFLNRLVTRQQIRAEVPITAANYAVFARNVPTGVLPSGVIVGRATSIDGYNPATTEFTGSVTSTGTEAEKKTVSSVSSFTGISVGTELEGLGIPEGTTVAELKTAESKLVMSAQATATHAGETIKAIGSYENERYTCTFVTSKSGKELSAEAMTKLETWLSEHREINFKTPVRAPKYKKVYVTTKVHVLPGYEATTVAASVKSAVESLLSPETWGNPTRQETGSNSWLNKEQKYNVVRYNQILGAIEAVAGVGYVFAGAEGLKIGFAASPTETADLTLPGPAPLPETEAAAITVTTG